MFSGLSEYLFGSSSSSTLDQSSATDVRQGGPIQETETDDDWVLVDVTNEGDSPSPRRSPRRAGAKDGFQSRPQPIPSKPHRMEESWFITPPPCFTAGGHSPQQLATSPMEDLLIEHPSMSVYHQPSQRGVVIRRQLHHHHHHHNQRPKPTRTVAKRSHNLRVRNAKPPRRAAAVAARVGIEQSANAAAMQEQQQARRHQQRLVSRSKLERHNKAHHQQSASSRRHYRHNSLSSGRHSGAIYKQPR
ncbi:uncharacterized protein [Diadema antillarum]|uniref:uncharacterized protein n=1 Tax=Diadema antillarum TaxID=105358 RepID=UPI003A84D688